MKKSTNSQLGGHIADALREISDDSEGFRRLDDISSDLSPDHLNLLLTFLKLFNVLEIKTQGKKTLIRAGSFQAKLFLLSLAIYIEKDLAMVSNWDKPGRDQKMTAENMLDFGVYLLGFMEEKRFVKLGIDDPISDVEIALIAVKTKIKGHENPHYLFQFNARALSFQMIGGYVIPEDKDTDESVDRLVKKELGLNNLVLGKNYSYSKVLDGIENVRVSSKRGALTRYKINLYQLSVDMDSLKLAGQDRWVSFPEMVSGVTEDGFAIKSLVQDFKDTSQLEQTLGDLPLSLKKEQKPTKIKTQAADTKHRKVLLDKYINQDEGNELEFKSSVRWDYKHNKVNKGLEMVFVKTVAGFLNTTGGVLLLGLDDKKHILGIDNDITTLNKKNEDGYMQYLINLISSYLGIEFVSFIAIDFEKDSGKTICKVTINKALHPVFLKVRDAREFYVRAGNTTRMLNAEEVYKYIQINW